MKTSIARLGLVVVTSAAIVGMGLLPFAASADTLVLNSSSVAAGASFTASGACGPSSGSTVSFMLVPGFAAPMSLGSVGTTTSGAYSTTLTLPTTSPAGSSVISATCSSDGSVAYANLVVQSNIPSGSTTSTSTSTTTTTTPTGGVAAGANALGLILGLVLAGLGAMGVALGRKLKYI